MRRQLLARSLQVLHGGGWENLLHSQSVRSASRLLSSRTNQSRPANPIRQPKPELNKDITVYPRVMLISEDGKPLGEMTPDQALLEAQRLDRDVLTVSKPKLADAIPVVRLVDYEAMLQSRKRNSYASKKVLRESSKNNRKATILKQVRFSPSIDEHDFLLKLRQAQSFLVDGHRVRIFMQFRRGQGRLQDNAKEALSRAATHLATYGSVVGSNQSTDVQNLFPPPPEDAEVEIRTVKPPAQVKAKPLEVFLQPLKKKDRERLLSGTNKPIEGEA